MKWWFRRKLYTQILVCIVVGVVLGLTLGDGVSLIKPVGTVFIRLLKMLIVPLTFLTLVAGLTKLDGIKSLRSLGGMTLLYYAASSLLAGGTGMALALILQPGRGVSIGPATGATTRAAEIDFVDNLVHWVPVNPVEALASGNMLQIIFFSIVVGVALLAMGKRAERLTALANDGAELMIRVTEFVMKIAPYGILALVANMTASVEIGTLKEVGKFILTQQVSLLVLLVVVYPLAIRFIGRLSPLAFYRNASPAMLVAASTTSSAATLPISMGVARENLGCPEKVWGFTLPLGATINMDGMASCIGVIAVFSCNLYGRPITPGLMLQFLFLGLALSIGTAGVKGAGIVTSAILLQATGVPTAVIVPILASVWPVLDIGNTCCNVTGDLAATAVLASRFGMLDEGVFDDRTTRLRSGEAAPDGEPADASHPTEAAAGDKDNDTGQPRS